LVDELKKEQILEIWLHLGYRRGDGTHFKIWAPHHHQDLDTA